MDDQSGDAEVVAQLQGVHKHYGAVEALTGMDLDIRRGELLAILGPNGAGKTTAVGILLGQRLPDAGSASLFGRSPVEPAARRFVGATPQETGFPDQLRVREVVELVRSHYPDPVPTRELLSTFGLWESAPRRAGGLSGGQKRRLAVALAFAGRPRTVLLDEPTTGLDVESRRALWDTIRGFVAEGNTAVLTTHYLEEAQALASRVVVLAEGRVVAEGSVDEISARAGLSRVRLRAPRVPDLPEVVKVESTDGHHTLYTADPDTVVRALALRGVPFSDLQVERASLEEAFLNLMGGTT
jgi:ABC-2 type transport system ATP-binding protein